MSATTTETTPSVSICFIVSGRLKRMREGKIWAEEQSGIINSLVLMRVLFAL
jgi:hypothetical protein